MFNRRFWYGRSILWLLEIFVAAAGLAAAITILNLGARAVMGLGGFVASGGPYEIAVEAPGWIGLIPISILSGFGFGGFSMFASSRSGGYYLVIPVWGALFVSLGIQFALMGLNPPWGEGLAWGWVLCAVVFIPMGLYPVIQLLRGEDMLALSTSWRPPVERPYERDPLYRKVFSFCVLAGAAGGMAAGLILFRLLAG